MQLGELSNKSGCTVATIKYYLREGLLQPGVKTSSTRAEYDDSHLTRLRLIRAMVDVGGLSLAIARSVIDVVNDDEATDDQAIQRAVDRLGPPVTVRDEVGMAEARGDVAALVNRKGWHVEDSPTAMDLLASSLLSLRATFGAEVPADVLEPYGDIALRLARDELNSRPEGMSDSDFVAWAVTGTVVFERVLIAWRRLAHAHVAREIREEAVGTD